MAEEQKKGQSTSEDERSEPAEAPAEPEQSPKKTKKPYGSHIQRLKNWYLTHKKWSIPASVLIILIILASVPWTRYNLASLAVKRDFSVQVMDTTAHTPVSGATVSLGSISAETDATGKAVLHNIKAGHHLLRISKKYYQSRQTDILSPIFSQKTVPDIALTATGRQVKITVSNLINKTKLADVDIRVAGISAKTDSSGSATVVLPVGASQQKATLSLAGYNDASVTVQVSNDKILNDDFTMTPAGKVYFLSNLSGNLDVVKTNLDGTDRQTVLAGTGNEDENNTVLLASRDWKYLALLSRRAGDLPTLYLIKTADDSLSTIDEGNASFNVIGWAGDDFVYQVTRNTLKAWQPHHQAIKSFDASTGKLNTLDQTNAQGTSFSNYVGESYSGEHIVGNRVIYAKTWSFAYSFLYAKAPTINDKSAGIYSINADGTNPQQLKLFPYDLSKGGGDNANYDVNIYIYSVPSKANGIYYQEMLYRWESAVATYYVYNNGKITQSVAADYKNAQEKSTSTYLLSPSGSQTFWSEPRDGKNTLLTGDADGNNGKTITTSSDYNPYGWYTNNYLLVSKDANEIYIMPVGGSNSPVKISGYKATRQNFDGYGGGYGGL